MSKKKPAAKKRKAQDATLRNVRASKNRDGQLGAKLSALEKRVGALEQRLNQTIHSLRSLAAQL